MKDYCGKCAGELPSDGDFAKCGECFEEYHLSSQCSISRSTWMGMSEKKKNSWRCSGCRTGTKEERLTKERLSSAVSDAGSIDQSELGWLKEVAQLKALITAGQVKLEAKIESWQQNIHQKSEEQTQTIKRLEGTIERLLKISEEKDKRITDLETRLISLEAKIYENYIEIHGVHEERNAGGVENREDTQRIAVEILQQYDGTLAKNDINHSYRKVNYGDKYNGKSPIIVELKPNKERREIVEKYKKTRKSREHSDVRIFEYLSNAQRSLLWETKERARREEWKYVWIQEGSVLARKSDGEKVLKIKTLKDLDKIVKSR